MDIDYTGKDQDWQNEQTTYWFSLTGVDRGTGVEFWSDEYGIVESGGFDFVVDCDGNPLTDSDWPTIAVRKHCRVTDSMR